LPAEFVDQFMVYNYTQFNVTWFNSSLFFFITSYFNAKERKINYFYLYILTCLPYEASIRPVSAPSMFASYKVSSRFRMREVTIAFVIC